MDLPAVHPTIGEAAIRPAAKTANRIETLDCIELGSIPTRCSSAKGNIGIISYMSAWQGKND